MAISPTIPTSFVPRAPVQAPKRRMVSGNNPFLVVSLIIAGVVLSLSGGVFLYGQYLDHVRDDKAAQLTVAQKNINQETVQDFIRLRNRFASAKTLLNNHVKLSELFDVLEGVTLQNVRFTTLKVTVAGDHTAQLAITGTAKNFNTLAAQSNALAGEKRIKQAIFSGITLNNKDNTVGFTLTANLDSSLVTAGASSGTISQTLIPAPSQPTTPVTTPAATTSAATTTNVKKAAVAVPAKPSVVTSLGGDATSAAQPPTFAKTSTTTP